MVQNLTLDDVCRLGSGDIVVFHPKSDMGETAKNIGLEDRNLYLIEEKKEIQKDGEVVNVLFKVREYIGHQSFAGLYGYGWFRLV